jgi:hypothetical protein
LAHKDDLKLPLPRRQRRQNGLSPFQVFHVDILQILCSTRRFSKITPLRRSMDHLQMRYREGAKGAKLREEKSKI